METFVTILYLKFVSRNFIQTKPFKDLHKIFLFILQGAHCADHHLQEIDKQYPGFINRKMAEGIQLSFQLQSVLQKDKTTIIRGYK